MASQLSKDILYPWPTKLDCCKYSPAQARLNQHQHYLADIEDEGREERIHSTHTTSSRPDAIAT